MSLIIVGGLIIVQLTSCLLFDCCLVVVVILAVVMVVCVNTLFRLFKVQFVKLHLHSQLNIQTEIHKTSMQISISFSVQLPSLQFSVLYIFTVLSLPNFDFSPLNQRKPKTNLYFSNTLPMPSSRQCCGQKSRPMLGFVSLNISIREQNPLCLLSIIKKTVQCF